MRKKGTQTFSAVRHEVKVSSGYLKSNLGAVLKGRQVVFGGAALMGVGGNS